MARKINNKLIQRMTQGDLLPLLNYIKTEKKLRLEVRQEGKAIVYYKKCKILELGADSFHIDGKYFVNGKEPENMGDKVINNPEQYFKDTLSVVKKWLENNRKEEFKTQQNIASDNQEKNDRYIILDMEYNFSQSKIDEDKRMKRAGFDLLGVERETEKIVFFEVKKGLKALSGNAGIKSHINDFENCLYGMNKDEFRNNLIVDIKNIVSDKKKLGLIDNFDLPDTFSVDDIDLTFVFEAVDCNNSDYSKIFEEEYKKSGSEREYKTIYVSKNNYKLI